MSLVFKTGLLFRKKTKQKTKKHFLTPFWDVPQQIMELHLVALCRQSHSSSSWPYSWASLSPYVLCTPPLKSLQASDGKPACMSAYEPHTLRATDRTVFAKSAEAFDILCPDYVSVCVPTWHMLFPAEESKTRYPLWNAHTVTGCWLLAGGRQLQHPPTFQTSRTDKTRRTS